MKLDDLFEVSAAELDSQAEIIKNKMLSGELSRVDGMSQLAKIANRRDNSPAEQQK